MAYVRGHAGDYDRWRQTGLTGWSYADALPYFRRAENWEGGEDDFRGSGGPLTTHMTEYQDPLTEAWLEAAKATGHEITDDYNGKQNEGFCLMQSTIRDGRRCSAAAAYLRPAIKRPNVTVETAAFVDRIVLQNGRAVGVAYTRNGAEQNVRAEREVILSGGVINSPQLLMLSGIGEPDQLADFGIETKIELPGVGKNLQDHLSVGVEYWRKGKGTVRRLPALRPIGVGDGAGLFVRQGTGDRNVRARHGLHQNPARARRSRSPVPDAIHPARIGALVPWISQGAARRIHVPSGAAASRESG